MAGLSYGRRRFLLRGRIVLLLTFSLELGAYAEVLLLLYLRGMALLPASFNRFLAKSLFIGSILFFCGWHAQARQAAPADSATATPLIVNKVQFSGNDFFSDEVLHIRVRTEANRRFLGLPGFTWWLWLYRLGESGKLGNRMGEALMNSGEPPAYLDASVVAADVERLELFYLQEGFRQVAVASRVDTSLERAHVDVSFLIKPGSPTYIRNVVYEGLDSLQVDQQLKLVRGSFIPSTSIDEEHPLQYLAQNQRYSEPLLLEERRRVLAYLRDEGYAAVTRDSIRAIIIPTQSDSFDVSFRIQPGPRYRFGEIHFDVTGPESLIARRGNRESADEEEQEVTWKIQKETRLKPSLLMRSLQFQPGDWYSQSQLLATKRRLEGTGVFSFTNITSGSFDTQDASLIGGLPQRIEMSTRQRHQVRFETFLLQRSGVLGASDNELGAGLGVSYTNANLFGGGEAFNIRMTGSVAASADTSLLNSTQAEVITSLTVPYLIKPFQPLDRRFNLYQARTRLTFSWVTARRRDLRLIIRGRGALRTRLEMQHKPTLTSFVDVLDFSLSNPDTLEGFQRAFLDDLLGSVQDPVQRAQLLEDYTQPQINNALRYTIQSSQVNPLRRERGYIYEAAFEIGGNLPYLLDRYVFTPGVVEGSLPGLPFFEGRTSNDRLIYRQYLRMVTDLRRYQPLSRTTVLATKLIAGVAHPTGRADVVPFGQRFFSGGASSIRGWRLRTLGPGAASFSSTGNPDNETGTNILGGDIKLEASIELRTTLLSNILKADWILAFFTDAGNIWFGPRNPGFPNLEPGDPDGRFAFSRFYKEIAVGSGVGFRTAWEYLIIRLDVGYRMYDPAEPNAGIFQSPIWYFGIGHAF